MKFHDTEGVEARGKFEEAFRSPASLFQPEERLFALQFLRTCANATTFLCPIASTRGVLVRVGRFWRERRFVGWRFESFLTHFRGSFALKIISFNGTRLAHLLTSFNNIYDIINRPLVLADSKSSFRAPADPICSASSFFVRTYKIKST